MDSLSSTTPVETPAAWTRVQAAGVLIVSVDNPVAADYAAHARLQGETRVTLIPDAALAPRTAESAPLQSAVVFLAPGLTPRVRQAIDALAEPLAASDVECLCIVSSFRIHLGDQAAAETEAYALARLAPCAVRTVVLRSGHVLSPRSPVRRRLQRLGGCYPLVPRWLQSCLIDGAELFAAIDDVRQRRDSPRIRHFTLLGPNRSWRDVLQQERAPGLASALLTAVGWLLALLLVGRLAALVLRRWHVPTLRPASLRELCMLVNPYNYRHVKVVGYNNGVVHFGHAYPAQTVVSTVTCRRIARVAPDLVKADAGVTIRQAADYLAQAQQQLPVVPNYSYVCLGTAFFVPIHGSAADFTTVADTITHVVLYDPVSDSILSAKRTQPAFRDYLYRLNTHVLLLRLTVRVQAQARYVAQRQTLDEPAAATLLEALSDGQAANVEIRKSGAAAGRVEITRYYQSAENADLTAPRDALGSLWDRLEANAVTSFLFHLLVRRLAWHVELFLTPAEFVEFWRTHRTLPLKKLQLRYIRRDGFPHSPFRDGDCVSVDTFMLRKHRAAFETYLRQSLPHARLNPGKHSA